MEFLIFLTPPFDDVFNTFLRPFLLLSLLLTVLFFTELSNCLLVTAEPSFISTGLLPKPVALVQLEEPILLVAPISLLIGVVLSSCFSIIFLACVKNSYLINLGSYDTFTKPHYIYLVIAHSYIEVMCKLVLICLVFTG